MDNTKPPMWNFDDHALLAYSCARAIELARRSAAANDEAFIVARRLSGDDPQFVATPEAEKLPAGWNPVALYDPDGTEHPA